MAVLRPLFNPISCHSPPPRPKSDLPSGTCQWLPHSCASAQAAPPAWSVLSFLSLVGIFLYPSRPALESPPTFSASPNSAPPCPSHTTPRHSSHTEPQSSGAWTRWGTHGTPLWVPTARAELGTEKILKTHLKDKCVDERVHHGSRPDPSKWAGGHRKQRGFFWEILENQQVFFFFPVIFCSAPPP